MSIVAGAPSKLEPTPPAPHRLPPGLYRRGSFTGVIFTGGIFTGM
jgi:hypothetical protein